MIYGEELIVEPLESYIGENKVVYLSKKELFLT